MAGILWADHDYGASRFHRARRASAPRRRSPPDARWRAAGARYGASCRPWSRSPPAVQFLHFALFQEELLSLHYYLVTFVLLLAVAWVGYAVDARAADGDAIFMGLRKGRTELARALDVGQTISEYERIA